MHKTSEAVAVAVKPKDDHTAIQTEHLQAHLAAIHQLGQELTLLYDAPTIIHRVLETAAGVLQFEFASVGLVDETAAALIYDYGLMGEVLLPIGWHLPLDQAQSYHIGVAVVRSGQPLHLPKATYAPRYVFSRPGQIGHSELCVPLKVGSRVIGVLHLESARPNHFSPEDQQLSQILADRTAVALENARLYAETQRRARELAVLRELDQVITTSLRLDEVFQATARHTARLLAYDTMSITLLEGDQARLSFVTPEDVVKVGDVRSVSGSPLGWVVSQGQPLLDGHQSEGSEFDDGWPLPTETKTSMIIPLWFRGQIIGTWNLSREGDRKFSPADLVTAQAIAAQLSIAIEHGRLYQNLQEQMRLVQEAQAQLVRNEKLAALGQLSATIVHEINNPLQAIKNALHVFKAAIDNSCDETDLNYSLSIFDEEIERIAAIMNRMRNFYRPVCQNRPPETIGLAAIENFLQPSFTERQSVDLILILNSGLHLIKQQVQSITVKTSIEDKLPLVQGNPDHLKQVVLNLLLNAAEALAGSGGTLRVSTASDWIERADGQRRAAVRLEISDTGQGISKENLPHLFEPFFTTKEQGSGLGLFISAKIIEAHRGQIAVESREGLGTTFTVMLPVEEASQRDEGNHGQDSDCG